MVACRPRLIRTGYFIQTDYKYCEKIIKYRMTTDSSMKKMGQIRFSKFGTFGKLYSEANALNQLKREACTIDADLIIITKQKRNRFFVNAYRCTAEFYKFKGSDTLISDEIFETANVQKRVAEDEKRNSINIKLGVLLTILTFILGGVAAS